MLFWIFALPFMAILALFSLNNSDFISLSLWPLPWTLEAPLSLALFVFFSFGFLFGSWRSWFHSLMKRRACKKSMKNQAGMAQKTGAPDL